MGTTLPLTFNLHVQPIGLLWKFKLH